MKAYVSILIGLWLVLSACASKKAEPPPPGQFFEKEQLGEFLTESAKDQTNEYIISIGDKLDIVFLYHQDLTTQALIVRSDGRISLPYVGDVMAAGYTPMKLDTILTARFEEILREPNLSVIVRESAGKVVYVLGEVARSGGFDFDKEISLLQSVALAGGITTKGKANHAVVIRREGVERVVGVEVDIEAIMRGEAIQNDFLLRNNDIVYVPKKRIESVAEFVTTLRDILRPPMELYIRGWEVWKVDAVYEFYRSQAGREQE
ncbi:MAG: hypothetical protein GTO51_03445 [Candidatus Latescibacteria bacterium]|nr:hypothetical protein [Candidatus Latescibacterota bacterium]NIM20893.1 hypothetical protein [Candidatus Latescibacterota bacterium]NIM65028.1 hypothetical protein [Candidatus Latescibacterota bacterium]NIO01543.1 hypothetical protein [Candidatus Latescibacterota bacterium]NIO28060.1 hypothetical protein [Candidatus Latescibacterota bacterium]